METLEMLMKKGGTRLVTPEGSQILPITSREMFDAYPVYSESKSARIKATVKWEPMDEEWKKRCRSGMFWYQDTLAKMKSMHPQMDDRLYELREKLLSFAGDAVCLPGYEDDLDNILSYGQFWIGNNLKMMRGLPSQCHSNTGRLFLENPDTCRICTGYALSSDGMWRQHSWCLWMKPRSNQIVETTKPRVLYFGFVMTKEQSEWFAEENY